MTPPARNPLGRRIWELEMLAHLYFLLLIMMILDLRVKITIDRNQEFGQSRERGWALLVAQRSIPSYAVASIWYSEGSHRTGFAAQEFPFTGDGFPS
jgi:hypothetical protein